MRGRIYLKMLFLIALCGCTQFEDAPITNRNTFVHFFSSQTNYVGMVAELDTDGGYILAGEIRHNSGEPDALIIKTDARGHRIWEKVISNTVIRAVRPHGTGYVLAGDSLQYNPGSAELTELENSYARLLIMNPQGNIVREHITTAQAKIGNTTVTVDYHANAFDISSDGEIAVLGTYRIPGQLEAAFLMGFDPSDLSDSLWSSPYAFLEDDLYTCRAVHVAKSSEAKYDLVWATRIYTEVGNLTREYLGVSRTPAKQPHSSHKPFGQLDARNHSVADIQKSPVGYCVVGTYLETNGSNGNIHFLHLDHSFNALVEKYIDGEELMLNSTVFDPQARTNSRSIDEGLAVIATSDGGFVIGAAMTSTPAIGNGGTDILLIKLDAGGNLVWKRLIGGSGDERISSIRETPDRGLLLCGTNTVNGLSTILLIKTDRHGNLDN